MALIVSSGNWSVVPCPTCAAVNIPARPAPSDAMAKAAIAIVPRRRPVAVAAAALDPTSASRRPNGVFVRTSAATIVRITNAHV